MEHSKAVQTRLGEVLKQKTADANQMFLDVVCSLKHDVPDKTDIFTSLADEKVSVSQKLVHCRGLIQGASDNVLNEMAAISAKAKANRRISVIMNGFFAGTFNNSRLENRTHQAVACYPSSKVNNI